MREEVRVGAQLVNVEPVLLAVGQTASDKCLRSRGRRFTNSTTACVCLSVKHWPYDKNLIQITHISIQVYTEIDQQADRWDMQ